MTKKEREELFKLKSKIKVKELLSIDININDPYVVNKKKLIAAIPGEQKVGLKGRKYYASRPGIWAVRSPSGKYYDIAETSSILNEMIKVCQLLSTCKRDVRKNIYKNFQRNVYKRFKLQQIYKDLGRNKKLEFVVLEYNDDKEDRLLREIEYAIKLKAEFWSPAPKQNSMIVKMKGRN